ncbi:MAG: hypothetical protein ACUVTP_04085, partial [Candidatus Fervidibacter sp.]
MLWWVVSAILLSVGEGQFKAINLAPYCNRTVNINWEDTNSFAGLVFGERWVFGVPFYLVDPTANNAKAIVKDAEVPVNALATFVFALVANLESNAKMVLRFEGGDAQEAPLSYVVPAIIAHPPLYRWHLDMIAVRVGQGLKQPIKSIRVEGAELFALTLSTHSEGELTETFERLARQRERWQAEQKVLEQLQLLRETLTPLGGRVTVLPVPPPDSFQSHPLFSLLNKAGLT